jgi:hypothetical protein
MKPDFGPPDVLKAWLVATCFLSLARRASGTDTSESLEDLVAIACVRVHSRLPAFLDSLRRHGWGVDEGLVIPGNLTAVHPESKTITNQKQM